MDFLEYKTRMKKEYDKMVNPEKVKFPSDEELLIHFLNNIVMRKQEIEQFKKQSKNRRCLT